MLFHIILAFTAHFQRSRASQGSMKQQQLQAMNKRTASGHVSSDLVTCSGEEIGPIYSLQHYEDFTQSGTLSNVRYILQTSDASSSDCDEQEIATSSSDENGPKHHVMPGDLNKEKDTSCDAEEDCSTQKDACIAH